MPTLRSKSVILILLCSAFSLFIGRWLDQSSGAGVSSYRAVFYGARCLLQHADPYDPAQFTRTYMAEDGALPADPTHRPRFLRAVMVCVNLPTTLFLLLPLALLPWGVSHVLWLAAIALSLTAAAVLTYDLTPQCDSVLPLFLICFMMANCEVLFTVANTAGIAVGLCVIAIWCFVRNRFEGLGVLALAISLALKPHDSGLVWLWLLASGGLLRKRAIQTAVLVIAIALPAVLVVRQSSPHWRSELTANLAATSARGDISDPGPASSSRKGSADIIIDLQTVLSLLHDDSRFYNPASLLIVGCVLGALLFSTFRIGSATFPNAWLALAAVSALTMLPSYHRPYDARLLLLAIPASAVLWARDSRFSRAVAIIGALAIVFTADIPIAVLSLFTGHIDVASMGIPARVLALPIVRSAPLLLLLLAVLFTVVFIQRSAAPSALRSSAAIQPLVGR